MPISATGADRATPARNGFTLVELMVVVSLIGLMSTLVVLAIPDGRPRLTAEAERFGARLVRAREEAVLTNRAVEVEVTAEGYAFRARRRGEWRPLEGPFEAVAWSPGTSAILASADSAGADAAIADGTVAPARVAFDSTGFAAPASLTLSRDGERIRVEIDGAGEVRIDAPPR